MRTRSRFWIRMGIAALVIGTLGLLMAGYGSERSTPFTTATANAESGFAQEWKQLIAAAQKEGKLIVEASGGAGRRYRPVAQFFAKKFGINVTFATGRDAAERIMAERHARRYLVDIMMISQSTPLKLLIPGGALAPLPPLLIHPEVTDTSLWFRGRHFWGDSTEKYIFFYAGNARRIPVSFYYNTKLLTPDDVAGLKSMWDFVKTDPKPSWAEKVVAEPPTEQATQYANVYAHPDLGAKWIRAFVLNKNIKWQTNDRLIVDGLARGKYAIAIFLAGTNRRDLEDLQERGIPVKEFTKPLKERPYISLAGSSSAIHQIDRPPHPNAAKLFLNWWLTREGQTVRHERADSPPPQTLRVDNIPPGKIIPSETRQSGVDYVVLGGSKRLEVIRAEGRKFGIQLWRSLRK